MVTLRTDWSRRGRERGVRWSIGFGTMPGRQAAVAAQTLLQRGAVRCTPALVNSVIAAAAVVLLALYAGTVIGENILSSGPAPVAQVRVESGDTLWKLATRYGNPNEYILRRVQRLAAENNLTAGASLRPGQTLKVHVENPQEMGNVVSVR